MPNKMHNIQADDISDILVAFKKKYFSNVRKHLGGASDMKINLKENIGSTSLREDLGLGGDPKKDGGDD